MTIRSADISIPYATCGLLLKQTTSAGRSYHASVLIIAGRRVRRTHHTGDWGALLGLCNA